MEEHFNENYIESETYPKATFKGKLVDFNFAELELRLDESDDARNHGCIEAHQETAQRDDQCNSDGVQRLFAHLDRIPLGRLIGAGILNDPPV